MSLASRRAWAFERGTLWVTDLPGEGRPAVTPHLPAVFGEVQREAVEPLAAAMGLADPEPVRRRLATGRRCFAAWVAGQIAAYGWASQAAECVGELEREIRLQAGEAYIWNCATLPPYRRQGLYSALLSHLLVQLGREGMRRVWIGSSLQNHPSIRGFASAGFRPVIWLMYARFFSLCGLWVAGHPDAPGELVAAARRALTADHERRWGSLALGRRGSARLPACAQIEA